MTWRVEWLPEAQKQLRRLDKPVQDQILTYCRKRLATNEDPRRFGTELVGNLGGFWRYRIGDYRIICEFENECLLVMVVEAGHRRDIYRGH